MIERTRSRAATPRTGAALRVASLLPAGRPAKREHTRSLDRIKSRVPIWNKQVFDGSDHEWVNRP